MARPSGLAHATARVIEIDSELGPSFTGVLLVHTPSVPHFVEPFRGTTSWNGGRKGERIDRRTALQPVLKEFCSQCSKSTDQ